MEVQLSMPSINQQGMGGGWCILVPSWSHPANPSQPNQNIITEPVGIACSTVKANGGPTVDTEWPSADFRSYWFDLSFQTFLDNGTLNMWDDTNLPIQAARTDNRDHFPGLTSWKGSMGSGGLFISDKYLLNPQTTYKYSRDYRFNYGDLVNLYTFTIDNNVVVWENMQNVKLPLFAANLSASLTAAALALFMYF